ncbi:tetratricopeptide repeat protein [Oleiagrimonas soli]|uniref:Flp pilus assembly protein TadD n=1 Tax=Oleiagrimonas soli TaxID=1543381 RepID=A0A841KPG8_9GAMM|nr:tetratricopeptide repeat protein [Oleiagrimonas soli]MBB6184551.1 Flp pilus assembly protein TadD [Oleiagrimonas soli]
MNALRLGGAVFVMALVSACASTPHRALAQETQLQRQAATAYAQGDLGTALTAYRQLADDMPDDTQSWFRLGNVYARLNQPEAAMKAYRHVLQRDPNNAKAWHNLGVVYLHQSAAAFVESARTSDHDAALRTQSMHMATQLEDLAGDGAANGSAADPVPAPARATSQAGHPAEGAGP